MKIIDKFLEFIFPSHCLVCGLTGVELCLKCLYQSPLAERKTEDWILALYDYRHPAIKKAIHFLKYKNKKNLAKIFAMVLYERILEEMPDLITFKNFRKPILIPIPLTRQRFRERNYNQAELICQEIIRINNLRHGLDIKMFSAVLIKNKETEHQANIKNRSIRMKNLINSFRVQAAEKIKNQNLILIDDVTTTGATFMEAKKILKRAGARKVIALALAH